MAKSKPITAEEYVTAKLIETEENLTQANHHIKTLEEDLHTLYLDIMILYFSKKVNGTKRKCRKTALC